MADKSSPLTISVTRARCSEANFSRGQRYYTDGAMTRQLRLNETLRQTVVKGTCSYRVDVAITANGQLETRCTCPYVYGGDCKHIVATLLAWLNEPESFQPPLDIKARLQKCRKAELVELLLDIFSIHPHLVDDLDIAADSQNNKLEEKVAALFKDMTPWGHLSEDEVETQLRLIARRAEQLAQKGRRDLARRVYYSLILGCVNLYRDYGGAVFSPQISPTILP